MIEKFNLFLEKHQERQELYPIDIKMMFKKFNKETDLEKKYNMAFDIEQKLRSNWVDNKDLGDLDVEKIADLLDVYVTHLGSFATAMIYTHEANDGIEMIDEGYIFDVDGITSVSDNQDHLRSNENNTRYSKHTNNINESKSLHDYTKKDLYKMIKDTFSVSGILINYKTEVLNELIDFIDSLNEDELQQIWIGYSLNLGKITDTPEDFNHEIYEKVLTKLSIKGKIILDKYLDKAMKDIH